MEELFENKIDNIESAALLVSKVQVSFTNELTISKYLERNQSVVSNSLINYYSFTETSRGTSQGSTVTSNLEIAVDEKSSSIYYDIVRDISGKLGT